MREPAEAEHRVENPWELAAIFAVMILIGAAAALAVPRVAATATAGKDDPGRFLPVTESDATQTVAVTPGRGRVVHVVTRTMYRLYAGMLPGERHITYSSQEMWIDTSRTIRRISDDRQETLWRGTERIDLISGSASEIDAPEHPDRYLPGEPLWGADLGLFRRKLESGEATVVGSFEISGTPTLRLRMDTLAKEGGRTTIVDVRESDYVPIRIDATDWYLRGKRRLASQTQSTDYLVAESMPWDKVPPGIFDLVLPPRTWIGADRTMSVEEAASLKVVRPRWLGTSYSGLALANGALHYTRTGATDEQSGRGSRNWVFAPVDIADQSRPQLADRWVEAEYGADKGRNIKVVTYPRVPRSDWKVPDRFFTSREFTVSGRNALLETRNVPHREPDRLRVIEANGREHRVTATTAPEFECHYLIMDMGDATVLLQSVNVPASELERAAESLRRVEG